MMNANFFNSEGNRSRPELFNFSLHQAVIILEEHSKRDNTFPVSIEIGIIISYAVLIISGACANLLVSSVIMRSIKCCVYKNCYYIVNLNASDIVLCLFCIPFTVLTLVRRSWSLGSVLCKLIPFFQGSTVFVSAATVSAIAIDRYRAIVSLNPQKVKASKGKVTFHLLAIWISSFLLSLPIIVTQKTIVVGLPGIVSYKKCIEHWPSIYYKGMYTIVTLLIQFFIPITVLAVTHSKIKNYLNSASERKDIKTDVDSEKLQRELKRNHRATMVLMNISIVFAVSWLPWNILNILADFAPHFFSPSNLYLAFAICHMLAMTSATTNPILYGWLNTNIRHELLTIRQKMNIAILSRPCRNKPMNPTNLIDKTPTIVIMREQELLNNQTIVSNADKSKSDSGIKSNSDENTQ